MQTATAPDLRSRHLRRLRSDLPLYAAKTLWIRTKPSRGQPSQLQRFHLNWAQQYVHARVERQKAETGRIRAIVLKARQLGISTYIAARLYHGCTLWARRRAMVLADDLDRTAEIFGIYERFDEHSALRPPKLTSRRARELSYVLDQKLTVETARDKDTGRGSTLDYVHASEFAAWPYPVETLTGLLDAVPEDAGEIWIESTAKGVGNEFHEMWREAVAGESEWLAIFLPWWIDPGYRTPLADEEREALLSSLDEFERTALETGIAWETPGEDVPESFPSGARYNAETGRWVLEPEQLAWRRRKIRQGGELAFRQENPATAREAFLVSGAPFFDMDALEDLDSKVRPPIWRGTIDVTLKDKPDGTRVVKGVRLARNPGGWLRIWEMPEIDAHYVIAADTASGKAVAAQRRSLDDPEGERGGRDRDSADVIRVGRWVGEGAHRRYEGSRQVAHLSYRMSPEAFAQQLYGLGTLYSCPTGRKNQRVRALLGVERNHESGATTLRRLIEMGYRPGSELYVARPIASRKERPGDRVGFWTSRETRRPMLDALAEAVQTGTLAIPCEQTIDEMQTFVFADDGEPEAQEGCHDDRVMSLGIALEMCRFHTHAPVEAVTDVGYEVEDTPTGM